MSIRAFYAASIQLFLNETAEAIIGKISQSHTQDLKFQQTGAWATQIKILHEALNEFEDGHIFFEFQIPRMGKRADVVLLYKDIIYILEFKTGAKDYMPADIRQAHGYAIDLHHFHEGSHDKVIVPVLVATDAREKVTELTEDVEKVYPPLFATASNLREVLQYVENTINDRPKIDFYSWSKSAYMPTPTIIEAAQALYANHDVADIARNDAGAQNLHRTTNALQDLIHKARLNNRKTICFVTGVPGAGKTLVGLDIATNVRSDNEEKAVFLSGNGPLVEVLVEALARDSVQNKKYKNKAEAERSATAVIQNIHRFRDEYLKDKNAPPERVVIFDEAQRAWDAESASKFMSNKRGQTGFSQSEPEFLIGVMDRHQDWCVIVALIGGGQEINNGEAGLQGWVDAIEKEFSTWHVYYSEKLTQIEYAGRDVNFSNVIHAQAEPSLHLATSMRSFRAEKLSHMVHYLIHNDKEKANEYYQSFKHKFPIFVTRNLNDAKKWIKQKARADQSKGLIASSGANRLKPEGIFVKNRFKAAEWFLNEQEDVRSCHFLEDVATEFDIQGLELDWCLVGWDADYRYVDSQFEHWKFTGTTWKQRQQEEQKRYLENAYRVLLTRARQGMIIFVPLGDQADNTRLPSFYDETYAYLLHCGIEALN